MPMRQDKYADKTRKLRFGLLGLLDKGLSEQDAMIHLLRDDGNRSRKLDTWVKHGLWPIPAEELETYGPEYLSKVSPPTASTRHLVEPSRPESPTLLDSTRNLVEHVPEPSCEITDKSSQIPSMDSPPRLLDSTSDLVESPIDTTEEMKSMMSHLLNLYRAGRLPEIGEDSPSMMPRLDMKSSSFYLSPNLMKMAEAKAQDDPSLPAGQKWNRSTLVNYLLWRYVGEPSVKEIEG